MVSKMFAFRARAEIDANLALIRTCESIMNAYESAQSVGACLYNPVWVWACQTYNDSKLYVSKLRRYIFDE
jgi:hypothetical protein